MFDFEKIMMHDMPDNTHKNTRFTEFIQPFVCDDDFLGKRFNRYVDKVKAGIVRIMSNNAEDFCIANLALTKGQISFENLIKTHLFFFYQLKEIEWFDDEFVNDEENDNFFETTDKKEKEKFVLMVKSQIKNEPSVAYVNDSMRGLLKNDFVTYDFIKKCSSAASSSCVLFETKNENEELHSYTILDIINAELKIACSNWIRRQSFLSQSITKANYQLTLPEDDTDLLFIYEDVVNGVGECIQNYAIDMKAFQQARSERDNDMIDSYREEIQSLKKEIKRIKKENERLNERVEHTNKKAFELLYQRKQSGNDVQEQIKEATAEVTKENTEIRRNYMKLDKRYHDLQKKYNRLKHQQGNAENEQDFLVAEDSSEQDIDTLDKNGRYVFVMDDPASYTKKFSDEFPNSICADSNVKIDANKTDLVIMLTSHLGHDTYTPIRAQCKINEIPLVHCTHSNLDIVKEAMKSVLK